VSSSEPGDLAQEVDQQKTGFNFGAMLGAIDGNADVLFHTAPKEMRKGKAGVQADGGQR
jgi:hypothetical protein